MRTKTKMKTKTTKTMKTLSIRTKNRPRIKKRLKKNPMMSITTKKRSRPTYLLLKLYNRRRACTISCAMSQSFQMPRHSVTVEWKHTWLDLLEYLFVNKWLNSRLTSSESTGLSKNYKLDNYFNRSLTRFNHLKIKQLSQDQVQVKLQFPESLLKSSNKTVITTSSARNLTFLNHLHRRKILEGHYYKTTKLLKVRQCQPSLSQSDSKLDRKPLKIVSTPAEFQ